MRTEDSADFQQHVVARHELVPAVAGGNRQSFEQLRSLSDKPPYSASFS
jgi:hypothetical protein